MMDTQTDTRLIESILVFWFGDGLLAEREEWFKASADFDRRIAEAFGDAQRRAADGEFDSWADSPEGSLALALLLDQFPRNLFRGTAGAFACDEKARAIARRALERGFDKPLRPAQRLFLYLPFEHSEDRGDQDRSVALITALGNAEWTDYAMRHRDIIVRFGRFPHRNAALGRPNTPEEEAFLKTPGSSF